jgi:hypothetical protein
VRLILFQQRRRRLAPKDSSSSGGIDFLEALFLGSFAGGGGSLIGLDAGYVVGIVNVPRLAQSVECYAVPCALGSTFLPSRWLDTRQCVSLVREESTYSGIVKTTQRARQ